MNLWECDFRDEHGKQCRMTATGVGGAVGLRAVGWYFVPGPIVRCPHHRPDAAGPCRHPGGDDPGPNPCSICTATEEALKYQRAIAIDLGLEGAVPPEGRA